MNFWAATGVGVGAIVGGGILALAGVAFSAAGPAAIVAFAVNGVIAGLTALSMGEMASRFPQSGGNYTFARKVLSIEAAFTVGWVVWFASIVAAVLYALGFAHFALLLFGDVCLAWDLADVRPVDPATSPRWVAGLACASTLALCGWLAMRGGGGGAWANAAKVIVFAVLIGGGLWAVLNGLGADTLDSAASTMDSAASTMDSAAKADALLDQKTSVFFHNGLSGLVMAMGFSFIALQGFDLIAAVGGEVRHPARNLPASMLASLGIALAIYLPLLWIITQVGVPPGETIAAAAAADPEGIVAKAAGLFLGRPGYYLVTTAAVLSMATALLANLFAASRIAAAMAGDRNLPAFLQRGGVVGDNPLGAIWVTGLLACLLVFLLPDVASAGAASGLIFLVTFALAHWLALLMRLRGGNTPPPFATPFFPLVPVVGGIACLALAVFQGWAVPAAGRIAITWLGLGGLLFLTLFARRARTMDAALLAADPELNRLRGRTPTMLVPIANPANADAMISLAGCLVPRGIGRVMVQTVVVADEKWDPVAEVEALSHDRGDASRGSDRPSMSRGPTESSIQVLRQVLAASHRRGFPCETLTTVSSSPMQEIARAAKAHACESVLLGVSNIPDNAADQPLEALLGALESDVVILRCPPGWQLGDAKRILVPTGGRGGHDYLLARLIGSLAGDADREVDFLRVMPNPSSDSDLARARRHLLRIAADNGDRGGHCEVVTSDDAVRTITQRCDPSTLLILGAQRLGPRQKLFGEFVRKVARQVRGPIVIISRRG
ncbi:MAG: amino acid permease [Planctomycetota bacterium]